MQNALLELFLIPTSGWNITFYSDLLHAHNDLKSGKVKLGDHFLVKLLLTDRVDKPDTLIYQPAELVHVCFSIFIIFSSITILN